MEPVNVYTIKSLADGYIWRFKYDLNGNYISFEILSGTLTDTQKRWLGLNYPWEIETIKIWQVKLKKNFEITIQNPNLSFETLWNLYDNKVKRVESEKQYNKLKEADLIKLFLSVPRYKDYLQRKRIAQAHLSTYINQRYFEDDWIKA